MSVWNVVADSVANTFLERSLSSDVVVGIVSGLVTSIMIYGFSVLWKRILVPWYEERVYKGLDVAGEWRIQHTHPDMQWSQQGVLILRQTAHRLTGSMTLSPQPPNQGETRRFLVSGEIADRFVWARMTHEDRGRLGYAVVLLEVVGDGRTMKGQQAHYDTVNHVIDTVLAEFTRA